jgi:hypothetical protein
VLKIGVDCNKDMFFLIVLVAAAIAAIVGTGFLATRDGYRRVPTRRA